MRWLGLIVPLLVLSLGASTLPITSSAPQPLQIATWNLEWLVTAETAHAARLDCRGGRRTALPCDVALRSRDSADIARLAAYAQLANADVWAFQEVESAAIARRVFAGFDICVAPGRGLQHVGFAVRRNVEHRCGPSVASLALSGTQRAGLTLRLGPEGPQSIELLGIHLKSGCADADLDSGTAACDQLQRQAQILAEWIAAHGPDERFMVLGDFNRGDADVEHDPFWRTLAGGDWDDAPFVHAGSGVEFRNCHRGAPYARAIDHILISTALRAQLVPGSYRRVGYRSLDALRYQLSDHCPVRISLNRGPEPISIRH